MDHSTNTVLTDDSDAERSTNATFEALRTRRRRVLLNRLADRGAVDVSTLATEVAASVPADAEPDADCRDAVEAALRHADLPKLADLGFVAFDGDAVRLCPTPLLSSLLATSRA